jgi:hypothetical protein
MKKNLLVVLLVAVMVGAFAGVGQAAVIYADSVTGSGVTNAVAAIGAPNGDFATLAPSGFVDLTFGGYIQDAPGTDFVIFFANPQNTEPVVYVSARQLDGLWVNLDFVAGASNLRVYEIPGTGTAYYDTIRLTWNDSNGTIPILNGVSATATPSIVSVPEAGSLLLFCTGMIGLVGYRRVRRMQ